MKLKLLPQYVPLAGEESRAVRVAENFLIDFCAADFSLMPWNKKPAAIRAAQSYLLIVHLNNPSIADAFVDAVAAAAGLTKSELQKRIEDRAEFLAYLPSLLAVNPTGVVRELEKWILL